MAITHPPGRSLSGFSPQLSFLLSILGFISLVLMALFCAAIGRDSVSLFRFPFLCHVHVFLCGILLVCRLKCPYCYFSSHFCFLVIFILLMLVLSELSLVTVISFLCAFLCSLRVVVYSVNAVFNAGKSSSSSFS